MRVTIDTEEKTICPKGPVALEELARLEGLLRVHYGDGDWRIVGSRPKRALEDWPDVVGQPVPMPSYQVTTEPYTSCICGTTLTGSTEPVSSATVTVAAAWDGQSIVAT